MSTFFGLLSFVAFILAIVGLIKPSWLKQSTRGKILLWYGGAFVLLFIIAVSISASENPTPTQQADTGSQAAPAAQTSAPESSSTPSAAPVQQAAAPAPVKTVPAPTPKPAPTPVTQHTPTPTPAPTPAQPQTVLDISGSGSKSTQTFTVNSSWQMKWSYDCSSFGDQGNFQVYVYTSDGSLSFENAGVNQLGNGGSDTEYYHTGGSYYLEVNSECNWHLTVQS
jgi:hypothetical protein